MSVAITLEGLPAGGGHRARACAIDKCILVSGWCPVVFIQAVAPAVVLEHQPQQAIQVAVIAAGSKARPNVRNPLRSDGIVRVSKSVAAFSRTEVCDSRIHGTRGLAPFVEAPGAVPQRAAVRPVRAPVGARGVRLPRVAPAFVAPGVVPLARNPRRGVGAAAQAAVPPGAGGALRIGEGRPPRAAVAVGGPHVRGGRGGRDDGEAPATGGAEVAIPLLGGRDLPAGAAAAARGDEVGGGRDAGGAEEARAARRHRRRGGSGRGGGGGVACGADGGAEGGNERRLAAADAQDGLDATWR